MILISKKTEHLNTQKKTNKQKPVERTLFQNEGHPFG